MKKYISLLLNVSILTTTFFGFIIFVPAVNAAPLTYTATATAGMTYWSGTALSRINDGDISTVGASDYQVHPTNAIGKTITMTLATPSIIEDVEYYNRTGCCTTRIRNASMIFKDVSGTILYTYSFPNSGIPNITTISDPGGNIVGVKTVELTNFIENSQNFREIIINGFVNTPPTDISLSNNTIDEGLPTGTTIGILSSIDSNPGDTHTYSLGCSIPGSDDSSFTISGSNLNSNAIYDYATKSSYNICIRSADSGGLTYDENLTITINNPAIILDFEIAGGYTVTSGTWTRQTTQVQEGVYAIEADNGGVNNSTSCFARTETISTDSILKFQYKVSSEANYDFLRFYIDGVEDSEWSGDIDWTEYVKAGVTAGTYTFSWCYEKDGSVNSLSDTAWVDIFTIQEDTSTTVGILDFEVAGGYTVSSGTWTRQTTQVQEGVYAIEADNGGVDNTTSCFTRDETLTLIDDQISFWYKVSSEASYDFLRFYVDGSEVQNWSGEAGWSEYSYNPGTTGAFTFQWCYTKDGSVSNGSDTAWVDDVSITTFSPGDTTPPVITSVSIASGSLLPGGNHPLIINHNDTDSGIDTGSVVYTLNKWNGVSAYGVDISGTQITTVSITTATSNLTLDNLVFGKYRFTYNIDDNDGNTTTTQIIFYIDSPEFIISIPEIDMGNLSVGSEIFSPTVTMIVKTVGAGFDISFNRSSVFTQGTENLQSYSGSLGYGYQKSPYTGTISPININQNIASENANININGNKNTYTYDIQIAALIDIEQASGDYSGNLDFDISLDY